MTARVHLYWQLKRLEYILTVVYYSMMPIIAYTAWRITEDLDAMVALLGSLRIGTETGNISFLSHHPDPLLLLSVANLFISSAVFDVTFGAFLALLIPSLLLSRMAKKYGMCICGHALSRHQNKHGFIYTHCKGSWPLSRCDCKEIRFIHDTPPSPPNSP